MDRVQFIQHKGRKILHLDFTDRRSLEVLPLIEEAKAAIRTQPPKSVYTLTDVTGMGFNSESTEALKQFVEHNKPFVAAAAVVGVTGLKQIVLNAIMKFTGRRLHAFGTREEAKEWLAKQ